MKNHYSEYKKDLECLDDFEAHNKTSRESVSHKFAMPS